MSLLIGLLIGILIAGILDGLAFVYILRNPSILHKLVKLLPGNLADKWEGEFDVGFYGSDDDCCQGSCSCDKQWSESDSDNYNGA
jgi:hypothetical protein